MTDNIKRSPENQESDNEELDLQQLEDVSGGGLFDILKKAGQQTWSSQGNNDKS